MYHLTTSAMACRNKNGIGKKKTLLAYISNPAMSCDLRFLSHVMMPTSAKNRSKGTANADCTIRVCPLSSSPPVNGIQNLNCRIHQRKALPCSQVHWLLASFGWSPAHHARRRSLFLVPGVIYALHRFDIIAFSVYSHLP